MTIFALRTFVFSILPLLLAGATIFLDRSVFSGERKLEALLIYLFALGVAGSGIGNFFANFFLQEWIPEFV